MTVAGTVIDDRDGRRDHDSDGRRDRIERREQRQ
jgi:hypothetical protein